MADRFVLGRGLGDVVTTQQTAMSIAAAGLGSLFTGLAVLAGRTLILAAAGRFLPRIAR